MKNIEVVSPRSYGGFPAYADHSHVDVLVGAPGHLLDLIPKRESYNRWKEKWEMIKEMEKWTPYWRQKYDEIAARGCKDTVTT